MSRIRSIHPGLWTDERFVSVQPLARLLFIGIWNECDDQGAFEWSPLKLKMRLLPADNADAAELLNELEAAGSVLRYAAGGRSFGAVRNFAKFQRPKKPNSLHPETPESRAFCGHSSELADAEGSPVPNQFGTTSEIPPQMEDGGGKREEEDSVADATGAAAPSAIDLRAAIFGSGVPLLTSTGTTDRNARSMLGRWRSDYGDGPVLDALAAAQARSPSDPIPYIRRTLENRNAKPVADPLLAALGAACEEERAANGQAADPGTRLALPATSH